MMSDIAKRAFSEWFAYQDPIELEFAMRVVEERRPRVILEIGTAHNASLACWSQAADPELAIGIDPLTLPKTDAQQSSFDNLVDTYNLKIIPFRSTDPKAHEALEQVLNGRKIDFLFIDAEHIYEDVKQDYENYLKYMNTPAIIGFHDIYYSDILDRAGTGVWRLWEELRRKYRYDEIHHHSSMGIGIIYINEDKK